MVQTVRHRIWVWLGKVMLAGVIAFSILTFLSLFYYRLPAHETCPDGATDYHWQPDYFLVEAMEGIGWGRTNNEGYINSIDYHTGDPIDILIMGSSHMDGWQVPANDKTVIILNSLLPDKTVYNIGIAKHDFLSCFQNLPAAVKKYEPKKYIIIETDSIQFSTSELSQVLSGERAELPSYESSILGILEHIPYLRILNRQLTLFLNSANDKNADIVPVPHAPVVEDASSCVLLSSLLSEMADTAASSGAKVIIAYHPSITLNKDGSLHFKTKPDEENAFGVLCEENGIYFLSMQDRFQVEYDDNHILPYGFVNSAVGSGHLNKHGHRMMAEELYAMMQEVDL